MKEHEIVNRVAQSKLITIDLEDHYPRGERLVFDIKDWLYEGLILKEKDFREKAMNFDWTVYTDKYVALSCSSDAIIPAWAFMLISTYLSPFARKVVIGDLQQLESMLFQDVINELDVSEYKDLPVIIKGCSKKPVPPNAYVQLIQKLTPVVKSMMYGEACSSVPLYKKK